MRTAVVKVVPVVQAVQCKHRRQSDPNGEQLPCAACDPRDEVRVEHGGAAVVYVAATDMKQRRFWRRVEMAPLEDMVIEMAHLYLDDHRRAKEKPTLMDLADMVDRCDLKALEAAVDKRVAAWRMDAEARAAAGEEP